MTAPCERRDSSAESFGDLLLEALVLEHPTAVGRRPQAVDETIVERGSEQRLILLVSLIGIATDLVEQFVTAQQLAYRGAERMGALARPAMLARMSDHPGWP